MGSELEEMHRRINDALRESWPTIRHLARDATGCLEPERCDELRELIDKFGVLLEARIGGSEP